MKKKIVRVADPSLNARWETLPNANVPVSGSPGKKGFFWNSDMKTVFARIAW